MRYRMAIGGNGSIPGQRIRLEPEVEPKARDNESPVDAEERNQAVSEYHPVTGLSQTSTYESHSSMSLDDVATEPVRYSPASIYSSTCSNQAVAMSEPQPNLVLRDSSPRLSLFDWWAIYGKWFTGKPKMDEWDLDTTWLKQYASSLQNAIRIPDTYEQEMINVEKGHQHHMLLVGKGMGEAIPIAQAFDDRWWVPWKILHFWEDSALSDIRSSIDFKWFVDEVVACYAKAVLRQIVLLPYVTDLPFPLDRIIPHAHLLQKELVFGLAVASTVLSSAYQIFNPNKKQNIPEQKARPSNLCKALVLLSYWPSHSAQFSLELILVYKKIYGCQSYPENKSLPSLDNQKYYENTGDANGGSAMTESCNDLLRAIRHDSPENYRKAISSERYHSLSRILQGIPKILRVATWLDSDEITPKLRCFELAEEAMLIAVTKDSTIKAQQILLDLLWLSNLDEEDLRDIDEVYRWLGLDSSMRELGIYKDAIEELCLSLLSLHHADSDSSN